MWDRLRQADIVQAKTQLRQRVDETLLRHADELRQLDHEQAEIEALNRLLDEFSGKFKKGGRAASPPSEAPAAPEPDEPAPAAAAPAAAGTAAIEPAAAEPFESDSVVEAAEAEADAVAEDPPEVPEEAPEEPAAAEADDAAEPAADEATAAEVVAKANQAANAADKSTPKNRNPEPREPNQRGRPRTNFEAFSQAVAKVDRW